jgi:hypothetical protein
MLHALKGQQTEIVLLPLNPNLDGKQGFLDFFTLYEN